jgi:hypothetical protein
MLAGEQVLELFLVGHVIRAHFIGLAQAFPRA